MQISETFNFIEIKLTDTSNKFSSSFFIDMSLETYAKFTLVVGLVVNNDFKIIVFEIRNFENIAKNSKIDVIIIYC